VIRAELRTVRLMRVVLDRLPEVPVTVAVYVPETTVPFAVKFNELVELVLAGLKVAVISAGSPEAAKLTMPLKPLAATTLMVLAAVDPGASERAPSDEERLKLGAESVRAMEVELVWLPAEPVMVAVYVPGTAAPLEVKVTVLVVLVLVGLNVAVMPAGNPDTARSTVLAKPFAPITVIVLLAMVLAASVRLVADAERLKLDAVTFTLIVVLPELIPELPLTFTLYCPCAAVELALRISKLEVLVVAGLKAAVTPVGRSEADRLTLPLKPF